MNEVLGLLCFALVVMTLREEYGSLRRALFCAIVQVLCWRRRFDLRRFVNVAYASCCGAVAILVNGALPAATAEETPLPKRRPERPNADKDSLPV